MPTNTFPPKACRLTRLLRRLDCASLAVLRKLATGDFTTARKVLRATMAAAHPGTGRLQQVPSISFWDMVMAFPVTDNLIIGAADWTDGGTAPLEKFLMAQLLRYFRPGIIVEVGTYRGTTTRLLLDNCTDSAQIYTIDLPLTVTTETLHAHSDDHLITHRVVGKSYIDHPRRTQVTQILGDSFDPHTWDQVPSGVQFAFIDASHSYAAVRNDTEKLWPKLSPNAVVLWHDYTEGTTPERGVGEYLRERMAREPDIFICPSTDMGFRIPLTALRQALARIPQWFPAGDYALRNPRGPAPWLENEDSR